MDPVVLSRSAKTNGTTEVVISVDGVRFTGVIPTAMVGTDDEVKMVQAMASRRASENTRLVAITRPGRQEYA